MSKYVDAIIGHAIGDAMGVPTEFCFREKLLANPVTSMTGFGSHRVPAGTWSDDTSMEIATMDAYINNGYWNYDDIMINFGDWINDARFTANDFNFDVGRTCLTAIRNYISHGTPALESGLNDYLSNGNGSLMRILPVALYSYSKDLSDPEIIKLVNDVSSLTHRHDISKLGCFIYVKYVIYLLKGLSKEEAYEEIKKCDYSSYEKESIDVYQRILKNNIKEYSIDDISSSGYIVDTLECALWILLNSNSYRDTIIASTNIGNDTDTIGAVAGGMAGIIYGIDSIPEDWLNTLKKKDYLMSLALEFEKKIVEFKKDPLIGAAIGDIAGSRFEIHDNKKGKVFTLLDKKCRFTDDTVMTLAVAKAFTDSDKEYKDLEEKTIESMVEVGRKYKSCGFGNKFYMWLMEDEHKPYGSYGNGAAMRIGPVGVVGKSIDEIKKYTEIVTNVSHNHPDSIQGSEAVAIVIYMALHGENLLSIKEYINKNYFDENDLKIDSMGPRNFHINCVETVKQALSSFFNSYDFEDAIRNAISLGGDSDTIGAITGSMAAAYYGIPEYIYNEALEYLDDYLLKIHDNFYKKIV